MTEKHSQAGGNARPRAFLTGPSVASLFRAARQASQSVGLIAGLSLGLSFPLHADNLPGFNLTAKDGRFMPEQIEIPAGQKVRLVVKNEGPGPEEFESSTLNREKMILPGKSAEIFIGPLKPGTYDFYGEFHPRTARGRIVAR